MMGEGVVRILLMCVSAALVCVSLRAAHPQIAAAIALGCGVAAMLLSLEDIGEIAGGISELEGYARVGGISQLRMLKTCGIAMLAEFASDICRDANEIALAKRIDGAVKLGIVASALPLALDLMKEIAGLAA